MLLRGLIQRDSGTCDRTKTLGRPKMIRQEALPRFVQYPRCWPIELSFFARPSNGWFRIRPAAGSETAEDCGVRAPVAEGGFVNSVSAFRPTAKRRWVVASRHLWGRVSSRCEWTTARDANTAALWTATSTAPCRRHPAVSTAKASASNTPASAITCFHLPRSSRGRRRQQQLPQRA